MDVEEVEINICLDALSIDNRNVIKGIIFISNKKRVFPEKDWEDFIVVILTWWHKAIIKLINSNRNGVIQEFYFMDGPLLVRGIKISNDIVEFQFVKEGANSENLIFTCQTSINKFKKELLRITRQLLRNLEGKGWKTDEIKELGEMWKVLNE